MKLPFMPMLLPNAIGKTNLRWDNPTWSSVVRQVQQKVKETKRLDYKGDPFTLEPNGIWDTQWAVEAFDWVVNWAGGGVPVFIVNAWRTDDNGVMWKYGTTCGVYTKLGLNPTEIVLVRGIHRVWDDLLGEIERRVAAGQATLVCSSAPSEQKRSVSPIIMTVAGIVGIEWVRNMIRSR